MASKRQFLTVFILAFFGGSGTEALGARCEQETTGNLEALVGDSNIPIYGRGLGAGRKYSVGGDMTGEWCEKIQMHPYVIFYGSALFDNFDSTEFGLDLNYRLAKNWRIGFSAWNFMSLNKNPPPDKLARTRASSINQTTVRLMRDFRFEHSRLSLSYGHGIMGDQSVFYPVGASRPYVSHELSADYRYDLGKWILWVKPQLFSQENLTRNRLTTYAGIEYPMLDRQIYLQIQGGINTNLGVPFGMKTSVDRLLYHSQGIWAGFWIPIGKKPNRY